jgi:hypothetical protein
MFEPRWRFAVRPFLTRLMAGSPAKRERGEGASPRRLSAHYERPDLPMSGVAREAE